MGCESIGVLAILGTVTVIAVIAVICEAVGRYLDLCALRAKIARHRAGLNDEFDN